MNPLCVLIYPKTAEIEFSRPDVPYSILFIGSYLKAKGIRVKLFDQRISSNKEILQYIESNPVTHAGLSTMTGPQIIFAMELSRKIRQLRPEIKIIWGGIHVTVAPGSVLKQDFIDYIVYGEGEETLLELLQNPDKGSIKGALRGDDNLENLVPREFMDMDTVSLDWSLIDPQTYISVRDGRRYISFVTSRGCSFKCQYCYNSVTKSRWRSWSVNKVRQELEKILAFNVSYISFMDDNLAVNAKWLASVCEVLEEKDVLWYGDLRANMVTHENMDKFKNCTMVFVGAESGSQRVLDDIRKRIKVDDIFNAARVMHERGMTGTFSWIIGFPRETKEDVLATINAVRKVSVIMPAAVQRLKIFSPYPGSRLYQDTVEKGYRPPATLEDWGRYTREHCDLPYIKNPWWYKCISYVTFFNFYSQTDIIGSIGSSKPVFRPVIAIYRLFSTFRWKKNFFSFPLEFMVLDLLRKVYMKVMN
ncbi:MAG TPA: B12-binding domain-containing radical SAM protein [Nitrospirae bacterium]|nr:(Dimethylallyl)adenosine tRNA methylthiotransferase MiaB [bacterium BMS3Abin06]HDH13044.1 B12-binding domain-containing radical SAM protein [Nitrospirota bacterium]HDZ00597.1 B12-binding domain-containing radical SAM protein [Nitrospirota bacterium]